MEIAGDVGNATDEASAPAAHVGDESALLVVRAAASRALPTEETPTQLLHVAENETVVRAVQTSVTQGNDEEDVYALLQTAEERQRTFQELRDGSLEMGVRDDRKCDYAMTSVPRVPSARRPSARRASRPFVAATETPSTDSSGGDPSTTQSDGKPHGLSGSEGFVWRRHLEAYVAQLLVALRQRPDMLRTLLAAHFPKCTASSDGETPDDGDQATVPSHFERPKSGERRRSSFVGTSPKEVQRPFLCVNDVYAKLSEVGFQLGEVIYHQVRKMLLKSVKVGVIDRASNLFRLESMFKLELRRQITLERLYQAVLSKLDFHHNQTAQDRDSQVVGTKDILSGSQEPVSHPESSADMRGAGNRDNDVGVCDTPVATAHHFKMQALERILAKNRLFEPRDRSSVVSHQPRSDQLGDHIQEKVTAAVYSKTRENFPFWKDPPESTLNREDTTKLLRLVITLLMTLDSFRGLTVDQLIEIAKGTRWKLFAQGTSICCKDTSMDTLLVVMDGDTICDQENNAPSLINNSSGSNGYGSSDKQPDSGSVVYGELGLLLKTETWPSTLVACSTQAKVLTLPRESFDVALSKIFGARRPNTARDGHTVKRPTSSPAATKSHARTQPRPASSSIREHAIARFRQFRDDFTVGVAQESSQNGCAHSSEEAQQDDAGDRTNNSPNTSYSARPRFHGSVYQNYPTFPVSDGSSAGSHMFRLKCIQPIAFTMKSLENLIRDEWAPAFPDTSALIDYMSAVESTFLLDKRNVLFKENLRAVCTNLPFQDDPIAKSRADDYLSYYQDDAQDTGAPEDVLASKSVASAETTGPKAIRGTNGASASAIATIVDGDPMTLGQFADARRRISSKVGATNGGSVSQSMRNVFASSAATSSTLAKHGNAPFVNSCFVPEASFYDNQRGFNTGQTKEDDVDDAGNHDHQAADEDSALPEVDGDYGDESISHTASEHTATIPEISAPTSSTNARKMALDSIISKMADRSPVKRNVVDQEAARRVILQKHLYEANEGSSTSSHTHDGRKRSMPQNSKQGSNAGAASNAPLPLRVDLQRRMEAVLAALKMKPKAKLDLVLKYTHADHYDHFPDAVVLWEQAAHYILKREKALDALRKFELVASDPRRHFRSLSTHRLTEQKERDALFYQLNYASDLCRESLDELEKRCGDVVYMEDRQYCEKMKKDYTELLYEVEQERLRLIYKGIHPAVGNDQKRSSSQDHHGNQSDDASFQQVESFKNSQAHLLSGSMTVQAGPRFALTTPRESIYKSVIDRVAEEEREERERKFHDEHATPRLAHKLSAQVRKHRQAQLDGVVTLTARNQPKATVDNSQVRAATLTTPQVPQGSVTSSLKQVLESALGRR